MGLKLGTHYPCPRAVFTGRRHGYHFFDTRVHGQWHGPWTPPVVTGSVYRALVTTLLIWLSNFDVESTVTWPFLTSCTLGKTILPLHTTISSLWHSEVEFGWITRTYPELLQRSTVLDSVNNNVVRTMWSTDYHHTNSLAISLTTRIWTNAQRDGRPAEHRWRRLFNAAKFGSCPVLECRAVTLPRRESRWN